MAKTKTRPRKPSPKSTPPPPPPAPKPRKPPHLESRASMVRRYFEPGTPEPWMEDRLNHVINNLTPSPAPPKPKTPKRVPTPPSPKPKTPSPKVLVPETPPVPPTPPTVEFPHSPTPERPPTPKHRRSPHTIIPMKPTEPNWEMWENFEPPERPISPPTRNPSPPPGHKVKSPPRTVPLDSPSTATNSNPKTRSPKTPPRPVDAPIRMLPYYRPVRSVSSSTIARRISRARNRALRNMYASPLLLPPPPRRVQPPRQARIRKAPETPIIKKAPSSVVKLPKRVLRSVKLPTRAPSLVKEPRKPKKRPDTRPLEKYSSVRAMTNFCSIPKGEKAAYTRKTFPTIEKRIERNKMYCGVGNRQRVCVKDKKTGAKEVKCYKDPKVAKASGDTVFRRKKRPKPQGPSPEI